MKKNNLSELDPIEKLKLAKPAKTSDSRVEQLIQKSEANTSAKFRTPIATKYKFALITTPAVLAIVLVSGLNNNVVITPLRLDLGKGTSSSPSLGLGSADCEYPNRVCNDIMIPHIIWKYKILPSVTTETPDGHVFSLSNFGGEQEIARKLALDFQIDAPLEKKTEGDGVYSYTQYAAGSFEDELISVGYSNNSTWIDYFDASTNDWTRCQDSSNRIGTTRECSAVPFENMPNHWEAHAYVHDFLEKFGIHSGFDLTFLRNGDYLIRVNIVGSDLVASAHMVLNGQPIAEGLQFYWINGSKNLSMIDGTLHRAEDQGLFKTLSAEKSLDRMNKYVTLPSLENKYIPSSKTWEGMPLEERRRLLESPKVPIDVAISRAEVEQVTIYDAKRRPWVVPGFNYFDESGYLGSAFSLDSEYIQMDSSED